MESLKSLKTVPFLSYRKYAFCLIAVLMLLFGCGVEQDCCSNYDLNLTMSVSDSEGNDLLDPQNPTSFKEEKIKIYYVKGGVPELVNTAIAYNDAAFLIYNTADNYVIDVFVDTSEDITTTLVKWNSADTDTIRCEIERNADFTSISKVWYNGVVKWDGGMGRYLEIVK